MHEDNENSIILERLWKLYDSINSYIQFSDFKAASLLAVNAIFIGFGTSNPNFIENYISGQSIFILVITLLIIACFLLSVMYSILSIKPSIMKIKSDSFIYFKNISYNSKAPDYFLRDKFTDKFLKDIKDDEILIKAIEDQIFVNSIIATRKYKRVTKSIILLFIAIILIVLNMVERIIYG
jgi:hypothetical protein